MSPELQPNTYTSPDVLEDAWHEASMLDETRENPYHSYEREKVFGQEFAANIQALGFDVIQTYHAWQDGTRRNRLARSARENMRCMQELESIQPGLPKAIYDTFRIRNFRRYEPAMLASMYQDHLENPGRPYVLVLQAVADHNDVFARGRPALNTKLYEQLRAKGFGLKIYECNSRKEVYKTGLRAKWAHKEKGAGVAAVLLQAHGTPNKMQFGVAPHLGHISRDMFKQWDLVDLSEVLLPGAFVMCNSCSVGKECAKSEHSVAHRLAISLGATVMAPTAQVGYEDMRVVRRGQGVKIFIDHWTKKSSRKFIRGAQYKTFDGRELRADELAMEGIASQFFYRQQLDLTHESTNHAKVRIVNASS